MRAALAPVEAALIAQAQRSVKNAWKTRVRRFIRQPSTMDAIYTGLSYMTGAQIVAVAASLIETEIASGRLDMGFGGYIPLLNAEAVMLYGRALRRFQYTSRKVAA